MPESRFDALADAILIARRSMSIGRQAVLVGMDLSLAAMIAAAAGFLAPAAGAVLQEIIDVLAIGIALRAVLPGTTHTIKMPPEDIKAARQLKLQHDATSAVLEQIRAVADTLTTSDPDLAPVRGLLQRLETEILPHERADEEFLVPLVARALGGSNATADMSRTHAEIEHLITRLSRMLTGLGDNAGPEEIDELHRRLYGLYAILRLHNALEEEGAFSLVPDESQSEKSRPLWPRN